MKFDRIHTFLRRFYHYRSIRLTPEGTRFILLTLAVGIAAINTGNNLLYLLLAMMLSLIVMSGVLSEQCLKRLDLRRRLPEHVFANRPTTGVLSIANRKPRFPTFSLRVKDVVAGVVVDRGIHLLHLPPHASTHQSFPLLVTRRGRYRIEEVKLLTRFPFGLFMKAATLPLASEAVVYPEVNPLPEALVHDLAALGHDHLRHRRGPGAGLHNLRDYQAGDDSRAIHWKTSARQASLIVRETESEDERRVTIVLPTAVPEPMRGQGAGGGRPPWEAPFEQAVTLAASLAAHFHERGYALRLLAGDQDLPHGIEESHFYAILRLLALSEPALGSGSAPLPRGFGTLGAQTASGELTLLVLPWPDPRVTDACGQVSRVFHVWEPS